jgi:ribonuclease-3
MISRSGPPHAPLFVVEVEVQGSLPERAVGSALRETEKAAARALLEREGVL